MWDAYIRGFKVYLQLERSMADHTVAAYLRDVGMLSRFIAAEYPELRLEQLRLEQLQAFVGRIGELELAASTQARILSGLKSFFGYLQAEEVLRQDPSELLEAPKLRRSLPVVLSASEIDRLMQAIDHSTPEGQRNRAMLETLYSCGLRVSELIQLPISHLYLDAGFIRVVGKGNKERLVPIGGEAVKQIKLYRQHTRSQLQPKAGASDILFLNRRGGPLSRVMVFLIIKDLAAKCGLEQAVHPHTFRHSFATHMVEAGADLRAVQEMLGHRSITTTEIYTHLDRGFLRQTLERFHPRYGQA